jgi:hypothetical protein
VRDRDRRWWLVLIAALAFGAAGVVVPYIFVRTMPTDDPFMTSADYGVLYGGIGLIALIGLGAGVIFLFIALQKRRSHLRRLAALQGDESALPLANLRADPALAPDVTERPLELYWRAGAGIKFIQTPLLGLQAMLALVSTGVGLFAALAPIFIAPQPSAEDLLTHSPPAPLSVGEIILRVALAGVILAAIVAGGVACVRIIPHLFGRPFGVTATSSGLDARTEFGSHVHMTWTEMRLLEVEKGSSPGNRRFSLYAPGKRIAWTEYSAPVGVEYVPARASLTEQALRQAKLLSLVSARTGLAAHTLTRAMEHKAAPALAAKQRSNSGALLFLIVLLVGFTAADVVVPATPFHWVNWASAGSLALATLALIVAVLWSAVTARAHPAYATPPSAGAPSLDAHGVAYSLSWNIPLVTRLVMMGIGVCLAVNVIPGVWVLWQYVQEAGYTLFGSQPPPTSPDGFVSATGSVVIASFLGIFGGGAGVGLIYGAAIACRTTRIRADRDGLTRDRGRRQFMLLWSSIQDISWGAGRRGQFAYLVKGDTPISLISWPAGPQVASSSPPEDDTVPIGGDELAALVAARTGRQIRVRT